MKARFSIALILAGCALVALVALLHPPGQTTASNPEQPDTSAPSPLLEQPLPKSPELVPPSTAQSGTTALHALADPPPATTNKLERLARTREAFRAMAVGDAASALRAA